MEVTRNLSEKTMADYKIVKDAMAGNQKAFNELLKKYKDSVFFMLMKMVKNREDAEDLMFESFEKAFSSLRHYSPQYAFSTWLFKIASNHAIDFIRKQKAKIVSLEFDDVNQEEKGYIRSLPADSLTPQEEMVRQQRAALVRQVVSSLKDGYRRLVELRYFEEYSYEEIAEELNLPLGTVKAQLFRARDMLQEAFKKTELAADRW